ncbi:MAG: type II toxin-antitoxin system RelE/ParE family toxin [Nitrospiria bacterium]
MEGARRSLEIARKVRAGLDAIIRDLKVGNPLRDTLDGLRSLRVSRFRIIYRIVSQKLIEIVTIGPRRTIYEDTVKQLRR